MANRDLTTFRQVTQQVVENPSQLIAAGAEITENIIRQGEEAKVTEATSQAQLDLSALDNQYRIDFEGDPASKKGRSKYDQDRKRIFDGLGENISPFYKRQWENTTREIASRNDATRQGWALKQTRVNTVNSINTSMKNNFTQANTDGQKFGLNDDTDIEAFVNFGTSLESLRNLGNNNLGEESTNAILETYREDYVKSYVMGASDVNPAKAVTLLDSEEIKNSFSDPAEWSELKGFIEKRSLNFQAVAIQNEAIDVVKNNAKILNITSERPLTQLEVMEMSKGASPSTKSFLLKQAGFKSPSEASEKLSNSDKFANKAALVEMMNKLPTKENITGKDLEVAHNTVMENLNNGSITKADADFYTNQYMIPYTNQVEENLSQFEVDKLNWFGVQDVGFVQLQKDTDGYLIEDQPSKSGQSSLSEEDLLFNNMQKSEIYDNYSSALMVEAQKNGVLVADIMKMKNLVKRNKILSNAATSAKKSYLSNRFPEMSNMLEDNPPARIVQSNGVSISTGLSNGSSSKSVSTPPSNISFNSVEDLDKAGLPVGTTVFVNGVKGTVTE